jgi:O-antigen/teichoic acid export membrane protein
MDRGMSGAVQAADQLHATPADAATPALERLSARFGVTLVANIARTALSLATGLLIARHLGARDYGNLWFLLGTLTAVLQLLDAGASSAMFTMLSGRRNSRSVLTVYGAWLAAQLLLPLLVIAVLAPSDWVRAVWVGHSRARVVLAFAAAALMNQLWGVVVQMGEALRKTALVQSLAVTQSIVHLALVLAAVHGAWLTVDSVLVLLAAEYAAAILVLGPWLARRHLQASGPGASAGDTVRAFVRYCAPLGVYGAAGSAYDFADRWLLQRFAGAVHQGFFTIGDRVAAVSVLASRSVLNAFWSEIAAASAQRDDARLRRLYTSVSRSMYWIGAWFAGLAIPYSRQLLVWTAGPEYAPAWPILSLMLLVPVQQSLMQIGGVFLQATGRTRLFFTARMLMMLAALPLGYLLLAGPDQALPGLGFGAAGLAMKTLLVQGVGVVLQLSLIARAYHWPVDWSHQVTVVLMLGGWALATKLLGVALAAALFGGAPLAAAVLGAGTYALGSLALSVRLPWLVGLTRDSLEREARVLMAAVRGRLKVA